MGMATVDICMRLREYWLYIPLDRIQGELPLPDHHEG